MHEIPSSVSSPVPNQLVIASTTLCNSSSNICEIPKFAGAWSDHASKTIISDWMLQCSSSFIQGLPVSSHYTGCMLGGILLAMYADSFLGRKKLLFVSWLIMSVTGILTAFSSNIWMYVIMRFFSGLGRGSLVTCTVVLLTVRVGRNWRGRVGILDYLFFSYGTLSLPVLAFSTRRCSWRVLYRCTGIPVFVYCVIAYHLVVESPRWLFMGGYTEEAITALRQMSQKTDWTLINLGQLPPLQRENTINFSLYLSAMFNGLTEMPLLLITFFLLKKCNRMSSLLSSSIIGGIGCILTWLVGTGQRVPQLMLELCSYFAICMAYGILLVYSIELFPTCVRNFATMAVGQAIVLGGVVCPVLISVAKENHFFSYGLFGCIVLFPGLFVLCLPETKGKSLYDSMEDQERNESMGLINLVNLTGSYV
ncbi:Organic cation/carnitine transporter 2, putative [Theobroma cacao]|uniref:Organic cation/carnitine transporter 2, putative n=1 Tax=Theobroma cacao TaxID=3641 RepID=A0A061F8X8_THECC|nr:Organic cation/carnitine transporter 2, putative [Theobroma cacao]